MVNVKSEGNNRIPIHFVNMVYLGEYFWFSAMEWNGCYRLNIKTGKNEFIGVFDYSDVWCDRMFNQVLNYQDSIFFIPWFSNYLVCLNTETLKTKYWRLPEKIISEVAKFRTAVIYNGNIYMFPQSGDEIFIFNIKEEKFECDSGWIDAFRACPVSDIDNKFVKGCQVGEVAYLGNLSGSFIVEYHLDVRKCKEILFPKEEEKIVDVVKYNNTELLVLTWKGNVFKYDIYSKHSELIYRYNGENDFPYRHVIVQENYIYLIPMNESKIIKLKGKDANMLAYPIGWKIQSMGVNNGLFNGYYKSRDSILLCPSMGNMLLRIEKDSDVISGTEITESNSELCERLCSSNNICHKTINLMDGKYFETYLGIVVKQRSVGKLYTDVYGNCIWDEIRGDVN